MKPSTDVHSDIPDTIPVSSSTVTPTAAAIAAAADAAATAVLEGPSLSGSLDKYRQECLRLEKTRHQRIHDAERKLLYQSRIIDREYDDDVRRAYEEYEQSRRMIAVHLLRENGEKMRRVEELRYRIVRDDVSTMFNRRHEMSLRGRGTSTMTAATSTVVATPSTSSTAANASTSNTQPNHTATSSGAANSTDTPLKSTDKATTRGKVVPDTNMLVGPSGLPPHIVNGYGHLMHVMGLDGYDCVPPPEDTNNKPSRRGKKTDPAKQAAMQQQRRPQVVLELDSDEVLDDIAEITGEKRQRVADTLAPATDQPARKTKKRK